MAEKEYRRLPGRGRARTGVSALVRTSSRLFLAKDHLLRVTSMGWMQTYKRFYFSDIQALVVCKTKRAMIWNIILGVLWFACVAAFAYGWSEPLFKTVRRDSTFYAGAWVTGVLAVGFTILFVINLLRGPSCLAQIQTPVSTEELPSLNRLGTAQKVFGQLRPLIEHAQGAISPDDLPAKVAEMVRTTPPRIIPGTGMPGTLRRELNYRGAMHQWLFTLLIATGLLTGLSIFHNHIAFSLVITACVAAAAILGIVSLVKQHQSLAGKALRGVTWGAMAFICIYGLIGYVNTIVVVMQHPKIANDQWQMLKFVNESYSIHSPWRVGTRAFMVVASSGLGISGLLLLRSFRRSTGFLRPADSARYDY